MRKKVIAVIAGVAVVVCAAACVLMKTQLRAQLNEPAKGEGVGLTIDANVDEWTEPTAAPEAPGIAIAGITGMKLPAGVTEAEVSLRNPKENEEWYYLTYQLYLAKEKVWLGESEEDGYELILEEEPIFETGLIPAGMCCNKVTLSRPLEKGTYDAVMHVQPYFMDEDHTPTNNLDMDIQLTVQ